MYKNFLPRPPARPVPQLKRDKHFRNILCVCCNAYSWTTCIQCSARAVSYAASLTPAAPPPPCHLCYADWRCALPASLRDPLRHRASSVCAVYPHPRQPTARYLRDRPFLIKRASRSCMHRSKVHAAQAQQCMSFAQAAAYAPPHIVLFGAGYVGRALLHRLESAAGHSTCSSSISTAEAPLSITVISRTPCAASSIANTFRHVNSLSFAQTHHVHQALSSATHIVSSVPPPCTGGDPVVKRYGAAIGKGTPLLRATVRQQLSACVNAKLQLHFLRRH